MTDIINNYNRNTKLSELPASFKVSRKEIKELIKAFKK